MLILGCDCALRLALLKCGKRTPTHSAYFFNPFECSLLFAMCYSYSLCVVVGTVNETKDSAVSRTTENLSQIHCCLFVNLTNYSFWRSHNNSVHKQATLDSTRSCSSGRSRLASFCFVAVHDVSPFLRFLCTFIK